MAAQRRWLPADSSGVEYGLGLFRVAVGGTSVKLIGHDGWGQVGPPFPPSPPSSPASYTFDVSCTFETFHALDYIPSFRFRFEKGMPLIHTPLFKQVLN